MFLESSHSEVPFPGDDNEYHDSAFSSGSGSGSGHIIQFDSDGCPLAPVPTSSTTSKMNQLTKACKQINSLVAPKGFPQR